MSEFPANVRLLMEQLTKLYKEIALLIQTADTVFAEKRWEPVTNSVITGSNSIAFPEQWLARTVHRFYSNAAAEPQIGNALAFVSVLLFDSQNEQRTSEPLLTAGSIRYPSGTKADENCDYSAARYYIWMHDAKSNGQLFKANATKWPKWKIPWQSISILAVPLEEVACTQELRSRIIQPVIEDLSESSS